MSRLAFAPDGTLDPAQSTGPSATLTWATDRWVLTVAQTDVRLGPITWAPYREQLTATVLQRRTDKASTTFELQALNSNQTSRRVAPAEVSLVLPIQAGAPVPGGWVLAPRLRLAP